MKLLILYHLHDPHSGPKMPLAGNCSHLSMGTSASSPSQKLDFSLHSFLYPISRLQVVAGLPSDMSPVWAPFTTVASKAQTILPFRSHIVLLTRHIPYVLALTFHSQQGSQHDPVDTQVSAQSSAKISHLHSGGGPTPAWAHCPLPICSPSECCCASASGPLAIPPKCQLHPFPI